MRSQGRVVGRGKSRAGEKAGQGGKVWEEARQGRYQSKGDGKAREKARQGRMQR